MCLSLRLSFLSLLQAHLTCAGHISINVIIPAFHADFMPVCLQHRRQKGDAHLLSALPGQVGIAILLIQHAVTDLISVQSDATAGNFMPCSHGPQQACDLRMK